MQCWSTDGTRLAFTADWKGPPHIYLIDVDGGEPTEVVPCDSTPHSLGCWTPDGESVIYLQDNLGFSDMWIVDVDSLERRPLLETPEYEFAPALAPDGQSLILLRAVRDARRPPDRLVTDWERLLESFAAATTQRRP